MFLYRLALTLPFARGRRLAVCQKAPQHLLAVCGLHLLCAVCLLRGAGAPLPSYGGYVRYVVGIGITVLVGRYAILALNRYLERQKLAEAMPDAQRREELSYDVALARLAKNVPWLRAPVDLKNETIDFCPTAALACLTGAASAPPAERLCPLLPRLWHPAQAPPGQRGLTR